MSSTVEDSLTIVREIWVVVHITECKQKWKNTANTQILAHVLHLVGDLASSCCTEHSFFFLFVLIINEFTIFFPNILIVGKS